MKIAILIIIVTAILFTIAIVIGNDDAHVFDVGKPSCILIIWGFALLIGGAVCGIIWMDRNQFVQDDDDDPPAQ